MSAIQLCPNFFVLMEKKKNFNFFSSKRLGWVTIGFLRRHFETTFQLVTFKANLTTFWRHSIRLLFIHILVLYYLWWSGIWSKCQLVEAPTGRFITTSGNWSNKNKPGSCWRPLTVAVAVAPLAKAVTTQDGQGRIPGSFQPDLAPSLESFENSAKLWTWISWLLEEL